MNKEAFSLKSGFTRTNYSDFSAKYNQAYEWFNSFGFKTAATRLGKYKKHIDELSKLYESKELSTANFTADFSEYIDAISETAELLMVYSGLLSIQEEDLKSYINCVLSGKSERPAPNEFDPARDTAFELMLISIFRRAGFDVYFKGDADLIIWGEGQEFFIECKRLKSKKQVKRHIRKALKQLHKRYKTSQAPSLTRGLICLSISDLINPNHGILGCDTADALAKMASKHVDLFISNYKHHWQMTKNSRSIGVVVYFFTPAVIKSENLITTCMQMGVNNSCAPNTIDYKLLFNVSWRMANAEPGA
jgi:hypothetical protein